MQMSELDRSEIQKNLVGFQFPMKLITDESIRNIHD